MLNHLIQSTIFAAVAALLTLFLRNNRAGTRYWIWLTASLKFLIPFSLFVEIGHRLTWTTAPVITQPQVSFVMNEVLAPIYVAASSPVKPVAEVFPILPALWIAGMAAVLIFWLIKWLRVATALRKTNPITEGRAFDRLRRLDSTTKLASFCNSIEPGVFGILRPVLYLPEGITDHLNDAQLDAILAHELTHIRRRDNLTALLHMLVEAVFWFHPLAWWIGAKLIEERERACDEEVVRLGSDPEVYAESILKICRQYLASPIVCAAGISGSDLTRRIEAIMTEYMAIRLSAGKKLLLTAVATIAIAIPVAVGFAQSPAAPRLEFEAASIKPSDPAMNSWSTSNRNGTFSAQGVPLKQLILYAWNIREFRLSGAPDWIGTDRYEILAKAADPASEDEVKQMLQTLLMDRFHLTFHHGTKELPIYELQVGKKGAKLPAPDAAGTDANRNAPSGGGGRQGSSGSVRIAESAGPDPSPSSARTSMSTMAGTGMKGLADALSQPLGTTVENKTGIEGAVEYKLRWNAEELPISTALDEQLGLRLEQKKGPVDILIIDRIDRTPTPN